MTHLEAGNKTFNGNGAAGLMEITRREAMRAAWTDLDAGLSPECNVRHNARRGSAWETWYKQGLNIATQLTTVA